MAKRRKTKILTEVDTGDWKMIRGMYYRLGLKKDDFIRLMFKWFVLSMEYAENWKAFTNFVKGEIFYAGGGDED